MVGEIRIKYTIKYKYLKHLIFRVDSRNHYGKTLELLAQVEITYEDGSTETEGVINISDHADGVQVETGSGRYAFSYPPGDLALNLVEELNLATPVEDLMDNDQARAVLENYIPDLITGNAWNQYGSASLNDLAETYSDQLPSQTLNEIEAELSTIDVGESYSVSADETLATLIADKQARELLKRELPELINSFWLSQVMGYNLEYANDALPEEMKIDSNTLRSIKRDLNALHNSE